MAEKFKWYGKEVNSAVAKRVMDAIKVGCYLVEGDAKQSMKPGSGKEYKRGGKIHRASAPGQPPAVDTGRLRASISSNWTGSGMAKGKVKSPAEADDGVGQPTKELTGVVGSNVVYARRLELGFVGADSLGRIYNQLPRPYLRPALHKNEKKIAKLLKDSVK
ncbi:hypothetical protein ES705_51119 [subsurface metagenome]